MMKFARAGIAAALGAGALVQFFLWGGFGIGFTLLFWVLLIAYYVACGFPKGDKRHKIENAVLAVLIVGLALCYSLFANEALRSLNTMALIFLMGLMFLHGTVGSKMAWDRPAFIAELLVGYFVRPFACFWRPWKEMKALHAMRKDENKASFFSKTLVRIGVQVFAALIVAIPLLLVLTSLLAASDPVFEEMTAGFFRMFAHIRLSEIVAQTFVFLFLLPFAASAVWSYRDSYTICTSDIDSDTKVKYVFPAAFSITILTLVNVLYLIFAEIQFEYLFGAWNGHLPAGVTSAVYARNGFFELAFVAALNMILILCSIRLTSRGGNSGRVIRCLSIALLTLSSVQLVSALRRMYMYIMAYGMTELRYFVTAFMLLIAIFFVFFLVREFVSVFPLFRSMIITGAVALLILNFTVPDARIAQYNIHQYLSGSLASLDVEYIRDYLSADAHIILLQNEDAIVRHDDHMTEEMEQTHDILQEKSDSYRDMASDNWKRINWSEEILLLETK